MSNKYDGLKLDHQLCFPLYAAAKEVVSKYTPYLNEVGLTYTQYIAMMVLWDEETVTVKHLGERLFLDSGTLTPVLKALEKKGYVTRSRSKEDERVLNVSLTKEGKELKDQVLDIPSKVGSCIHLEPEEAAVLYQTCYKILGRF